MKKLTHVDLFSGIGGFSLGLEATGHFRTIAFSEIDPWCCAVLKKHWPKVKNYGDLRNVPAVRCDILTGGFPCQPFSFSGDRRGAADDRHLWPAMRDVIARCRPTWVIGENVPGIINLELDNCIADLEDIGYSVQPIIVPACAVDAKHRRDRVWIVAYSSRQQGNVATGNSCADGQSREFRETVSHSNSGGQQTTGKEPDKAGTAKMFGGGIKKIDGDTNCQRWQRCTRQKASTKRRPSIIIARPGRWPVEPELGRVVSGLPNRSHRLRAIGNSILPQIAEAFGKFIWQIES